MAWFEEDIPARIFCVFKDKSMSDLEISQDVYDRIHNAPFHEPVVTYDKKGRITFDGKRGEIVWFKHVYPTEKKVDEYTLNSQVYQSEKAKRDEFWKKHHEKMTQEQKDETWSIIYARWWTSYQAGIKSGHWESWKAYFRSMFPIIALELAGYKDKISSTTGWVIAWWTSQFEIPEVYGNTELYRKMIMSRQE